MDNASRFHGPATRALREKVGIKQADLARSIGISRSHLNNIEKGKQPSLAVAVAIAAELKVGMDAITYTPSTTGAAA